MNDDDWLSTLRLAERVGWLESALEGLAEGRSDPTLQWRLYKAHFDGQATRGDTPESTEGQS